MVLYHPTTAPSRHAVYHRMVARNRVWLARRNLPAPLVPVYLGVWLLLTLARRPSASGAEGLVRRLPGGLDHSLRSPAPHEVAYGMAADPTGPTSRHLTSSVLRASGVIRVPGASGPRPHLAAHLEDESFNCE